MVLDDRTSPLHPGSLWAAAPLRRSSRSQTSTTLSIDALNVCHWLPWWAIIKHTGRHQVTDHRPRPNMLQRLLHAAGLAALGSALLVLLGWASETTCHCLYQLLERRGVIERLIPGTVPSARRFSRQALSAFLLSTFPVLLLLGWNWDRLSAAARPSWNPLHASSFAYLVLVLHDTWWVAGVVYRCTAGAA